MWLRIETLNNIQVLPAGEEDFHVWDRTCECGPEILLADNGKIIHSHNSFDGRELFEEVEKSNIHTVVQGRDS